MTATSKATLEESIDVVEALAAGRMARTSRPLENTTRNPTPAATTISDDHLRTADREGPRRLSRMHELAVIYNFNSMP
ncbi:MAG TPA: hypothetical protein VMN56_10850 [Casimicrobiaceae bacterium]|nr:hypothetical protein [Casimicrobiaceae bacterium]